MRDTTPRRRGHGEDAIYFDATKNRYVGGCLAWLRAGREAEQAHTSSTYTVQQAVNDWLEGGLPGRTERTRSAYQEALKPLMGQIGAKPLRELTAGDARAAFRCSRWLGYRPSGKMEDIIMEIFRFDRDERLISAHGSIGLHATRIASGDGGVTVTCLAVRPGGTIGTHPATGDQLFLVIAGSGWVAGADGIRRPVQAGQGACWAAGEVHASGTGTGLTALAVEGSSLRLFEPEHS